MHGVGDVADIMRVVDTLQRCHTASLSAREYENTMSLWCRRRNKTKSGEFREGDKPRVLAKWNGNAHRPIPSRVVIKTT